MANVKDAVMGITTDFYRSSNGDRWRLVVNSEAGTSVVCCEPSLSSGGQTTETTLAEFLARSGASPQYVALREHLDMQGAVDTEE